MNLGVNGRFYRARVTGVQRFAREVTARLGAQTSVTLFLPRRSPDPPVNGIPIERGKLAGHAWEQLELPGMARAARCDVLLHLSGTAPIRGRRNVLVIHDVLPLTHPEWFSRRFSAWYRAVLPRAARAAAAIITVSEHSRQEIRRTLGFTRRIAVVPQGLAPFDRPAPASEIQRVRAAYNLPERFLLAVGTGDPRKNHGFLESVLARVAEHDPSLTLVVAGGASARVHGANHTVSNANSRIRRLGYVSDADLQALYSSAVAFCSPSLAEGFGRPPFEAAACGTPALVADRPEVAEPGRLAAMPLPLDANAWANAIISVSEDQTLRARLIQRGREAAAGMNWDETAASVLDVCAEVAEGASRRSRKRVREVPPLRATGT